MINAGNRRLAIGVVMIAAVALTGCTSTRGSRTTLASTAPEQLTPVETGAVQQGALPPVGSQQQAQANNGVYPEGYPQQVQVPGQQQNQGQPVYAADGSGRVVYSNGAEGNVLGTIPQSQANSIDGQYGVASAEQLTPGDDSFVSLDDVNRNPNVVGRDLTGELSVEKLLGGWTLQGASTSCRLNLTYTAKADTGRYRASAPGCEVPGMIAVSSWQLSGRQVLLYDNSGKVMATLLLSGDRFVGTSISGQGISMVS
jgi:hypothetical protein